MTTAAQGNTPYCFPTLEVATKQQQQQQQQQQQIRYLVFYHYLPDDNNYYHITCKIILQEDSTTLDDHYHYSHGFFYQNPNDPSAMYYVICRLLQYTSIESILNGMNVDFELLSSLSLYQKLSLEQSLRQKLFNIMSHQISEGRANSDCDILENVMPIQTANIQNCDDSCLPSNDPTFRQVVNEFYAETNSLMLPNYPSE